jgi:predicted O-linked N-acetylglucosamine transferase (SPINDLY family)
MPQITIEQALQIAAGQFQAGKLFEAEQLYRQILALQPNQLQALQILGRLLSMTDRGEEGSELLRRATILAPGAWEYQSDLSAVLRMSGKLEEAIAAGKRAIELRPESVEAYGNLGNCLLDQEKYAEAIEQYRRALELRSDLAEMHNSLGAALVGLGKFEEGIAAYRKALALRPVYPEALGNLAKALLESGQVEQAIACGRESLKQNPKSADAHNDLGMALKERGEYDQAIACYERAVELDPEFAQAWNNLGIVLGETALRDRAIAAHMRSITLNPKLHGAHSNLVLALHYDPAYDPQMIAAECRRWNTQHAEPLKSFIPVHRNDRNPDRRLKIGYVSPDFRDHVAGRNMLPLFHHHDRQHFEICCYAFVTSPDAMTEHFKARSDRWCSIVGMPDEQLANQIQEDQIDILVDLALHSGQNRLRLFARKPAPVQATFVGYPGSTGLTAIDYRLSDPYLDPPGIDESIYSEKTIRLPNSFWCYEPSDGLPVRPLPALETGALTFGCLNNFCKINPYTLSMWAHVLGQVQGSRLLLLAPPGSHQQRTIDLLGDLLGKEGIDPDRVEFTGRRSRLDYLQLYNRIDLGLDTFPYNGHTTSLDSLWMGVPVVTLVGQTPVSRAGWGQLSNLGLTDLAAHTTEQFVRIAVALANDLPRLNDLRSTLRQRMEKSPLMDAPGFTKDVEAAYRNMWRKWCG